MNLKQDVLPLLKEIGSEFQKDEAGQLGAALAYYAMFSMFPLLLLLVAALGYVLQFWPTAIDVQEQILTAVSTNFSPQVADILNTILGGVKSQAGGATIVGRRRNSPRLATTTITAARSTGGRPPASSE